MKNNRLMERKGKIYRNKIISLSSIILFSLCFIFSSFESEASAVYYHKHSTTSTTETTTDYNDSINTATTSNVYGGCYTEAVVHHHTSSCPSTQCTGVMDCNGTRGGSFTHRCNRCGYTFISSDSWSDDADDYLHPCPAGHQCSQTIYTCGYSEGQVIAYKATGCGKSNA